MDGLAVLPLCFFPSLELGRGGGSSSLCEYPFHNTMMLYYMFTSISLLSQPNPLVETRPRGRARDRNTNVQHIKTLSLHGPLQASLVSPRMACWP